MYAAIGVWNMEAGNWEEQQRGLHEEIVPLVRQSPGFVSGYWMGDRAARLTRRSSLRARRRHNASRNSSLGRRERRGGRRSVWATSRSSSRRYLPKPVADLSMSSIHPTA
jgi:hypothetical protein